MIKIEIGRGKTVAEINGILPVVYAEMTYVLKEFYEVISKEIEEEAAKNRIKRMAELAVMDDEELKKNTEKILEEKPELDGFANFIFNRFMR